MYYVEYLATKGYVPPHGHGWVDHIRKKGNEANHDIVLMTEADARDLLGFAEMLLKFIYEVPARVPGQPARFPLQRLLPRLLRFVFQPPRARSAPREASVQGSSSPQVVEMEPSTAAGILSGFRDGRRSSRA